MNVSYSVNQLRKAERDVLDVYRIAEERLKRGAIPCSLVQVRNAFQVFRYAFREWASGRGEGEVLRCLMLSDSRAREVRSNSTEMVIQVDDPMVAVAIEELLRRDGYSED